MRRMMLAALALMVTSATSHAEPLSLSTPESRLIEQRGVEAMIWGMPAVNTDLMVQAMLHSTKGKMNDVIYWSQPADWKNQTLTPNPDSIYFMCFWDVREGPLVIDVPPAIGGSIAGNIVNVWQMPLEDAGPEGADHGKGGKYIIVPPGFKGRLPTDAIILHSDTYTGFALLRSNLASHSEAEIAKSVNYGKQIKVYPLADANNPPQTQFIDAAGVLFDSTIHYDSSFYENLNRVVQHEPWLQRDRIMIDELKTIGIEKGKPYAPSASTLTILNESAKDAHELLSERYDMGFPVMNPGIRWFPAAMAEVIRAVQTGYANVDEYPVDARGVTYTLGFTGIKRIGTAQFYLMANKDKDGNAFNGDANYRLTVPPNVPVKQYWSVTVYDRETHALIRNLNRASLSSNSSAIAKNQDGSVDVYFGPKAPVGNAANWVPTDPNGKFELLFRLYGPEKPLFDRSWKLPDTLKVGP